MLEGDSGFTFLPLAHVLQRGVDYRGAWEGTPGSFGRSLDTVAEDLASARPTVMAAVLGTLSVNLLMFLRFFYPRALYEPKVKFRIGYPSDFGFGVDTKFQNQYRIWVVRNTEGVFVISAICTHLGCTPDWKASENKFKCPCHGSGYDPEGINFEGPAPRPMDRAHVELDPEGQIVVDVSKLYQWPKGERNQFNDAGAFIPL